MRKHICFCGLVLAITAGFFGYVQAAPITVTSGVFDITFYNDGDTDGAAIGQGNWTSQQRADVVAATRTWESRIGNTPGRQLQMHAFWDELDSQGTNVLGGSASYKIANNTTTWNLGEYVWKEGLNPGISSRGFDTIIQYDITAAGASWNFSTAPAGSGQIDFTSVVTHEIGHSLGWDSTYDKGNDDWGWFSSTYGYKGLTDWDKNLVDSAGNRPQSAGTGMPANFIETDNPVYFDGANAVAAYGSAVPVYAPATFQPGSSLVHLDESALGGFLMSPAIGTGQTIRDVSNLEWAMMSDMGWQVVPEPASVSLFILAGIFLRKTFRKC